jgi:uncharacterized membrane protein YgdD (TMEM256/DUF423 family)
MYSSTLRLGVVLAALSVALGAFGAHGLRTLVPADRVALFEIGVRYQFYHAFALILTGVISRHFAQGPLRVARWSFLIGILFFSGSLYLLTVSEEFGLPAAVLGPITPLGGVAFLVGWGAVFSATFKKRPYRSNGSGKD